MSDKSALLRKTVADFFEVAEEQVGPTFTLSGPRLQGSIARAALDSAIRRRVGLRIPTVYVAKTYGELEVATGRPAPNATFARSSPSSPATPLPTLGSLQCGTDIELLENLPSAADHWEDAFYRHHFTPAEIAYCLMQETPVCHFAARWCAKEALKKCDPNLLAEDSKDLEVVSDASGAPYFVHHIGESVRRLPHALSISHTNHSALAIVIRTDGIPTAGSTASAIPAAPASIPVPPIHSRPRSPVTTLLIVLNLTTLTMAAWALVRTFH